MSIKSRHYAFTVGQDIGTTERYEGDETPDSDIEAIASTLGIGSDQDLQAVYDGLNSAYSNPLAAGLLMAKSWLGL